MIEARRKVIQNDGFKNVSKLQGRYLLFFEIFCIIPFHKSNFFNGEINFP
jgi:hypothetical protein